MSDFELGKNSERDNMDGGFAVVDRERLIEEEVNHMTPWYKHVIHLFTQPGQMMEECLGIEPTKATSIGIIGCIIFTTIYTLFTLVNPINKTATYEALRAAGIQETALDQTYSMSMISAPISNIIVKFLFVLVMAISFQIVKVILRDKCKFATIYKMLLFVTTVVVSIQCLDAIVALGIGVEGNVFSIKYLLSETTTQTALGIILLSTVTLPNIIQFIYMAIGYKAITHTSIKKGILAVVIIEVITIGCKYLIVSMTMSMAMGMQ